MKLQIRLETSGDVAGVRAVNLAAFPTPFEADLVDTLRGTIAPWRSYVAVRDGSVVGHLLFTPVSLEPAPTRAVAVLALGPMAIHPDAQGLGIGSTLVDSSLAEVGRSRVDAVVVLGHPEWYPRFGFVPAAHFGLKIGLEAPPEAFLALEFANGALPRDGTVVHYHRAFSVG